VAACGRKLLYTILWDQVPLLAYSVEKLVSADIFINFGSLIRSNPLFLLNRVSTETPENRRMGVFQQNRPFSAIGARKEK